MLHLPPSEKLKKKMQSQELQDSLRLENYDKTRWKCEALPVWKLERGGQEVPEPKCSLAACPEIFLRWEHSYPILILCYNIQTALGRKIIPHPCYEAPS